jgi:ABC-type Na+ efflux pump permease subunit
MKYAYLIAVREYLENVKTKGFWIGILLFPVILLASIKITRFLEEEATLFLPTCLENSKRSLRLG